MSDPVVVGGRYQLATPLGHGGMAAVRVALDLRLGRWVAVKRPHSALAADSSAREGFQHEAWTAARLNHPNIVQVFDTGDEPDPETGIDVPYLVMEWVHGETLRSRLRREGP